MKKWTKLSSKQVFKHPRHNVYIDEVRLPNGLKTEYLHYGPINDAVIIIGRRGNKFLVQGEYSYPPDEVLLQFPGGALEDGETPAQGAAREFAEEANLAGKLEEIGYFYQDNRRSSHQHHVFVATNLKPAHGEKDPEEFFEDHWFTASEIDQKIKAGEITNYSILAAWAIYKAHKARHN